MSNNRFSGVGSYELTSRNSHRPVFSVTVIVFIEAGETITAFQLFPV